MRALVQVADEEHVPLDLLVATIEREMSRGRTWGLRSRKPQI